MKSINEIINDLPLGASALVEERVNHKNITFIIVKDRFKNLMESPWEIETHFKGGIIRKNNTISAHLIIRIKDNFNDRFYPFHFNYYDENSLKLLHNLIKQKKLYVVIGNKNNEIIMKTFNNNLSPFLKNYIKISIEYGHKWSSKNYKKAIIEIIQSFQDIINFWDSLGGEVYMESIKQNK